MQESDTGLAGLGHPDSQVHDQLMDDTIVHVSKKIKIKLCTYCCKIISAQTRWPIASTVSSVIFCAKYACVYRASFKHGIAGAHLFMQKFELKRKAGVKPCGMSE